MDPSAAPPGDGSGGDESSTGGVVSGGRPTDGGTAGDQIASQKHAEPDLSAPPTSASPLATAPASDSTSAAPPTSKSPSHSTASGTTAAAATTEDTTTTSTTASTASSTTTASTSSDPHTLFPLHVRQSDSLPSSSATSPTTSPRVVSPPYWPVALDRRPSHERTASQASTTSTLTGGDRPAPIRLEDHTSDAIGWSAATSGWPSTRRNGSLQVGGSSSSSATGGLGIGGLSLHTNGNGNAHAASASASASSASGPACAPAASSHGVSPSGGPMRSPLWARVVRVTSHTLISGTVRGVGDYVVWTCCVDTLDGGTIVLRKRYSEFVRLRAELAQTFPRSTQSLPTLPPKSLVKRFRDNFLERRRGGLEFFLNCVLLNPEFAGSAILKEFVFQ